VHDYFDILGLRCDAPRDEIRRAGARRAARLPPDFDVVDRAASTGAASADRAGASSGLHDIAIDFVDMSAIADRMQAAFFVTRPGLPSVAREV
jgi:hypothetical protein